MCDDKISSAKSLVKHDLLSSHEPSFPYETKPLGTKIYFKTLQFSLDPFLAPSRPQSLLALLAAGDRARGPCPVSSGSEGQAALGTRMSTIINPNRRQDKCL